MLKKRKVVISFLIGLSIALLFILAFVLTSNRKPTVLQESLTPVVVQKPVQKDFVQSLTLSGYVEASSMIPVVPFVSGTIMSYDVKAGDYVTKDTVLATIDDAPFRQQMLQAQAAYFAAQSTFERIESLYKSGATTTQNYDSAKAQRDASKAQYDLAQLQLDYTKVKSPVDGTVLVADLAAGSIGTQTSPVAVIADLTNQVVRLKVPEKYYDLFLLKKDDLKVNVIRPGTSGMYDDASTSATVENIAPYISAQSKNFEVVCRLNDPGERFRPGMYVKVSVDYNTIEGAYILPIKTKKLDGSCYIYNENDSTVSYVELNDAPANSNSFVVPSEYADSFFVVDGQNAVFDGQRVKVVEGETFEAL